MLHDWNKPVENMEKMQILYLHTAASWFLNETWRPDYLSQHRG